MRETNAAADAPPEEPVTGVHRRVALCGHDLGAAPRRGLCQRCYRKLVESGCPLPPAGKPGPDPTPALERWVRSLPEETRRQIAALLLMEERHAP